MGNHVSANECDSGTITFFSRGITVFVCSDRCDGLITRPGVSCRVCGCVRVCACVCECVCDLETSTMKRLWVLRHRQNKFAPSIPPLPPKHSIIAFCLMLIRSVQLISICKRLINLLRESKSIICVWSFRRCVPIIKTLQLAVRSNFTWSETRRV
jgi:hypothetical protein